eukprot:3977402-Prymnesium_polylepis.2
MERAVVCVRITSYCRPESKTVPKAVATAAMRSEAFFKLELLGRASVMRTETMVSGGVGGGDV